MFYSRKFIHAWRYANRTGYLCTGIRKDHECVPISEQQQQRDDKEEETNEWTISFT